MDEDQTESVRVTSSCNLDDQASVWLEKDCKKKLLALDSKDESGVLSPKEFPFNNWPKKPRPHDNFCAWADNKLNVRNPGKEPTVILKSGANGGNCHRSESFWRDSKTVNAFHFNHYADSRQYIEQYRKFHTLEPPITSKKGPFSARSKAYHYLPQYVRHYVPARTAIMQHVYGNRNHQEQGDKDLPAGTNELARLSYKHKSTTNAVNTSDSNESADSNTCNSPIQSLAVSKPYTGTRRADPNSPNGIGVNLTPTKPRVHAMPNAPFFNGYSVRKSKQNVTAEKGPSIVPGGVQIPAHDIVVPQDGFNNMDDRMPLMTTSNQDLGHLVSNTNGASNTSVVLSDIPTKSLMAALQAKLNDSFSQPDKISESVTKTCEEKLTEISDLESREQAHREDLGDAKLALKWEHQAGSCSGKNCKRLQEVSNQKKHGHQSAWKDGNKKLDSCLKDFRKKLMQKCVGDKPPIQQMRNIRRQQETFTDGQRMTLLRFNDDSWPAQKTHRINAKDENSSVIMTGKQVKPYGKKNSMKHMVSFEDFHSFNFNEAFMASDPGETKDRRELVHFSYICMGKDNRMQSLLHSVKHLVWFALYKVLYKHVPSVLLVWCFIHCITHPLLLFTSAHTPSFGSVNCFSHCMIYHSLLSLHPLVSLPLTYSCRFRHYL